jgi:uncharacterized protein (TIGR02996 family)
MSDEGFLRAILEGPRDDASPLVYADWLEEQGDSESAAKAEYLRLTVESSAATRPSFRRLKAIRKRLQKLAAMLDTDWLAVVSRRLAVENCQGTRAEAGADGYEYKCSRSWEDLTVTADRAVRFCGQCKHEVHYCDTIMQAREHAEAGHCIAVDLGVIRRKDDLEPRRYWVGMPGPDTLREEEERLKPDPVSAERESRRREKGGDTE